MKRNIIIFGIAIVTLAACNGRNSTNYRDADQNTEINSGKDEVVKGSVTNNEGQTLYYEFNNTKQTAVLTLNGEKINLNQDRMASGIQYSNDDYKYNEHQGKIKLTKKGEVIFEKE